MTDLLLTRSNQCPIPKQGRTFMLVLVGSLLLHATAVAAITLYNRARLVADTTCPVTNFIRVTLLPEAQPAAQLNPSVRPAAPATSPMQVAARPKPAKVQPVAAQQPAPQPRFTAPATTPVQAAAPVQPQSASVAARPAAMPSQHTATAPTSSGQGYAALPMASAVARTPMVYPPLARRRGYQGTVVLHLKIPTHGGRPQQLRVVSSSGYQVLDDTAASTVKNWSFAPSTSGQNWHSLPIRFALRD